MSPLTYQDLQMDTHRDCEAGRPVEEQRHVASQRPARAAVHRALRCDRRYSWKRTSAKFEVR